MPNTSHRPKKLLSQRHPLFYFLSVWTKRLKRRLLWYIDSKRYADRKTEEKLLSRIKKHQSVLLKKLGENNEQLQINKVTNLKIAAARINGIVILPGQTFSFCKLVGRPTKRKGYLPGMELSFGEARAGIGGGICQISNLIHWLVIHSPLTVTERYHHSFDPFPDDGRVLPFGSGATVFYNYRDYQFTNNTPHTFQINLWFTEKCLEGELRVDHELDYAYHVEEKEHQFLKIEGTFYRKNEIWRHKILKFQSGKVVETELVTKNFARVTYTPDNYIDNDTQPSLTHLPPLIVVSAPPFCRPKAPLLYCHHYHLSLKTKTMEKLVFNVSIDAPREKVWQILWGKDTYPRWTAAFSESSGVKTDNWKKGSKVLFVDGNNCGMVSSVAENIPNEYMSFEHHGEIKDGVEDTTSEKVKQWAGSHENYTLKTVNGKTDLTIDMDISEEYKDMFTQMWPKALDKVKELSEKN